MTARAAVLAVFVGVPVVFVLGFIAGAVWESLGSLD